MNFNKVKFFKLIIVFLFSFVIADLNADTITISNPGFETGPDGQTATNWDEPGGGAYFLPGAGTYNEGTGIIYGRAATMPSDGTVCIQQILDGITANDYDRYEASFYIGYKNDYHSTANIVVRVSLWDITTNSEIAGETLIISAPGVDSSQHPNVDMIVSRTVVFSLDSTVLPSNPIAVRFHNQTSYSPSDYAIAVVDNVSMKGFRRTAHWKYDNNLNDTMGNHNGSALPSRSVIYTDAAIDTKSLNMYGSSVGYGMLRSYSSALNPENFTAAAWVKVTPGSGGVYRSVFSNRSTADTAYSGWVLYADNTNKWSFWTGSSTTWNKLIGPTVVEGKWTFLLVTFQKTGTSGSNITGTKRLYIDGKLIGSQNVTYNDNVGTSIPFLIGAGANDSAPNYDYHFDGLIDDAMFYSYPLSSREVSDLYSEKNSNVVRIMSFNIQACQTASLSTVANFIKEIGPDIIGLQEVDNGMARSNYVNQAALLANELGMSFSFGGASYSGAYGNAILSKYPIISVTNHALPQYQSEETRSCIVAKIKIKEKVYTIANTHITFGTTEGQVLQVDELMDIFALYPGNKFLTGDFNFRYYNIPFKRLRNVFIDSFNHSILDVINDPPDGKIDFVFINHDCDEQVNFGDVISNTVSDHDAVLTEITLQP
ncbi:MAG: hypothetical protein A2Y10_18585 [Planctomycetes bacterium GWF2_41_51]|nr:MAG: hypothetical protein A2Y10_18585 [Planctomycetes bacterium GWF2_41_51]HBG27145.1 hypothetical protein [Phycisphaerales bacterium]